jgi:large subunit ribosomal protein L1
MAEDKSTEEIIEQTDAVETPVEETSTPVATEEVAEKKTAKAGKRSEKALKEAEEKEAKEERKAKTEEAEDKPKQHANPTRSRLERRGKNFKKVAEQIDRSKSYTLAEGLELATKTNPVKFDASVELHVNLNVDPRHADQNIRDNLVLPGGTGKTVRVAVMDDGAVEGADISGVDTLLAALEKGEINFDILIATPAQMPKLGKFARVLGPRGLMPNPKSGTVTTDVAKAVREAKAGRVEYRVDTTGIVHVAVGKVSFGAKKLEENVRAVLLSLKGNKPNSVKGTYVKTIHLATTMGPSITIDNSEL